MYRPLCLLLLLTVTTSICRAQASTDSTRIYWTADSSKVIVPALEKVNKANIIPDHIFSLGADVIHLPITRDTNKNNGRYGFQLIWPSFFIDGSLSLTVTRRQIYLVSGHDNPNPNHLYWFMNITAAQYAGIARQVQANRRLFKSYYKPTDEWYTPLHYLRFKHELKLTAEWTDALMEKHSRDASDKRYQNTLALITMFNKGLSPADVIVLPVQADFDKNDPIQVVYSMQDYTPPIRSFKAPETSH